MIKALLLNIALALNSSKNYNKIKLFFHSLFEDNNCKYKRFFDVFMIIIVLSSVAIMLYDVKYEVSEIFYIYDIYFVTTIFAVEYLIRMWVYNDSRDFILDEEEEALFLGKKFNSSKVIKQIIFKKLEYMRTPFAIIDLLAILPAYRPLRILRIFMLFRLFKVLRYTKSVNNFLSILKTKKFELITLLMLVGFITFIGGAVIYMFEYGKNSNIDSFFDALYWSLVTISTVGYGDISPVTIQGRILTMFLILSGIAFISFATSIVASAFTEKLQELKLQRIENEAYKLKSFYLICGYSKITQIVAKQLTKNKQKFIIVDTDPQKIEEASQNGFLALKADITKNETLKLFDFNHIKKVFILSNNDIVNTFLTLSLSTYTDKEIITIVNDKRNKAKIVKAGAKYVINPANISALFVSEYINNPVAFEVITSIFSNNTQIKIDEIEICEYAPIIHQTIKQIDFKKEKLILLGVLKSKQVTSHTIEFLDKYFYFNPKEDLLLEAGDMMLVLGDERSIVYFKEQLKKRKI